MTDILNGIRVVELASWTFVPAAGAVNHFIELPHRAKRSIGLDTSTSEDEMIDFKVKGTVL